MTVSRAESIMRVNLARSESQDWPEDAEETVATLVQQARARGRRYIKICDHTGKMLQFVRVAASC